MGEGVSEEPIIYEYVTPKGKRRHITVNATELVKVVVYEPKREAVLTFGWEQEGGQDDG